MKRLVAASDSHGAVGRLREVIRIAAGRGQIDAFVFLGDGLRDFEEVKPQLEEMNPRMMVIAVRGNNDFSCFAPEEDSFVLGGRRVLAVHGHQYRVKLGLQRLCYAAREKEADIALYGHTHQAHVEEAYGVWLVNPGAVCGVDLHKPAFADIVFENDGRIRMDLVSRNGTVF